MRVLTFAQSASRAADRDGPRVVNVRVAQLSSLRKKRKHDKYQVMIPDCAC